MTRHRLLYGAVSLLSVVQIGAATRQLSTPPPAVPADPAKAIATAFGSHAIVAVTAGHGEAEGYALLLSLIQAPRLMDTVNDIVIEEGNSRYQDLADRFVNGDDISRDTLAQVWRNTTQPMMGMGLDEPWQKIFGAVRALNATRLGQRRVRVLLGDPPIDWSTVRTREDHRHWLEMRDTFPADLIAREVLAKGRRALLTYGQMHFQRKNIVANYESQGDAQTIVSRLEAQTGTRVFSIWTSRMITALQADVVNWPVPSIASVRGTMLGSADFAVYSAAMSRFALRQGKADFSAPIPRDQWRTLRAEDQFDAVLYPGSTPSPLVQVPRARCADTADVTVHLQRMTLSGLPPQEIERLKQHCATMLSK